MKNEQIQEINELIDYGYQENDIFDIMNNKVELSENHLKRLIKATLIESFLILKNRQLDEEGMIDSLIKNFNLDYKCSEEISHNFYSNNFNHLHNMIENSLNNY